MLDHNEVLTLKAYVEARLARCEGDAGAAIEYQGMLSAIEAILDEYSPEYKEGRAQARLFTSMYGYRAALAVQFSDPTRGEQWLLGWKAGVDEAF